MAEPQLERRIWMLWFQGLDQAPEGIRRCIRSWQEKNPGWDVTVLSEDTLGPWVSDELLDDRRLDALTLTKRSSLIRLNLLSRHGGVWADASTYCRVPLDSWIDACVAPAGFFAFSWLDQPSGPMELRKKDASQLITVWFLAATKGHPLVARLYRDLYAYLAGHSFSNNDRRALRFVLDTILLRNDRTALWYISPFVANVLRIVPYLSLAPHLTRLVDREPDVRAMWDAMPKIDARPAFVPDRLGLGSPALPETIAAVDASTAKVFKLRRRMPLEPGSLYDYVTSPS